MTELRVMGLEERVTVTELRVTGLEERMAGL